MSNDLQLQLGSTTVDLSFEREELKSAISHIYRSFLAEPEASPSPPDTYPTFPDSIADVSTWRFSIDDDAFELDRFDIALRTLEDTVADCLLEAVGDCLLIHAGAVSNSNATYLIVGQSGSGKTTTTLEFLRRGYLYLTDEFTAIEPCGTVINPFPRTATRKFNSPTPAGAVMNVPDEQGYRSHMLPDHRAALGPRPLHSCKIIFPHHNSDPSPNARLLDTAELCSRLMPSIFEFDGQEKALWPALSNLVTRSQACELDYNSAETDLDIALNLFD